MAVSTIKTTVRITWTSAARVRMTANVDFPEYGISAGETFYLVRASANDGTYYIVSWDEIKMCWLCRCPARKPCKHMKLVNLDCRGRATAAKAPAVTPVQIETLVQDHELPLLGMAMKAQQRATTAQVSRVSAQPVVSAMPLPKAPAVAPHATQAKMAKAPLNGNKGFSFMR